MGLGSGIRKKPIPDPWSKRHRIPDPQHGEGGVGKKIFFYVGVTPHSGGITLIPKRQERSLQGTNALYDFFFFIQYRTVRTVDPG
jgi:hypothetical protein